MIKKFFTHINRGVIDSNRKNGTNNPPIVTKKGKSGKGKYSHELALVDENGKEVARIIYSPHKPILSCGARLVIVSDYEPMEIKE